MTWQYMSEAEFNHLRANSHGWSNDTFRTTLVAVHKSQFSDLLLVVHDIKVQEGK